MRVMSRKVYDVVKSRSDVFKPPRSDEDAFRPSGWEPRKPKPKPKQPPKPNKGEVEMTKATFDWDRFSNQPKSEGEHEHQMREGRNKMLSYIFGGTHNPEPYQSRHTIPGHESRTAVPTNHFQFQAGDRVKRKAAHLGQSFAQHTAYPKELPAIKVKQHKDGSYHRIVDGHARAHLAREKGWSHIPVEEVHDF